MSLIKSSELDFDQIKSSLKNYLKSKSEFADYDFEASGLSNILDVLAYNTHINALTANVGVNESFLTSAQLRSSVVSHAETLGYYPRSRSGSQAVVNISASAPSESASVVSLPALFTFSTSIDDVNYSFQTTEALTATNDGSGNFLFKNSSGISNINIADLSKSILWNNFKLTIQIFIFCCFVVNNQVKIPKNGMIYLIYP